MQEMQKKQVQEELQEGPQEEREEEEVPEDLLQPRLPHLKAPQYPSEPVVPIVRDRDRVYGDCLPNFPQPRKWRSPTRVRQALRPTPT